VQPLAVHPGWRLCGWCSLDFQVTVTNGGRRVVPVHQDTYPFEVVRLAEITAESGSRTHDGRRLAGASRSRMRASDRGSRRELGGQCRSTLVSLLTPPVGQPAPVITVRLTLPHSTTS